MTSLTITLCSIGNDGRFEEEIDRLLLNCPASKREMVLPPESGKEVRPFDNCHDVDRTGEEQVKETKR